MGYRPLYIFGGYFYIKPQTNADKSRVNDEYIKNWLSINSFDLS
jgi:hypothetical protein